MTDHFETFPAEVAASAPEREIARDLAMRTLFVAPVMLAGSAAFWGWHGLWSSAYGLVIVAANFLLGAAVITWSAKISPAVMFGAIMGGFVARLAIITLAVLPIRNSEWFEVAPFAISLLVTHLGLLAWETRHVAASLAFPGLKPGHAVLSTDPPAERSP
jgi:anti-sigma-K factor RskA